MIAVTDAIALNEKELVFSFIRASGPGGQNVNKVATAAQLRFDALSSGSLPPELARRLIRIAGSRATQDGVIVLTAQRFRSQERNRADAVERLARLIQLAAEPRKPRRATRPPRASIERRLSAKARRGAVKSLRSAPERSE